MQQGKSISEPARETPVIREVDVVVAGGGPAGTAAAIAAARGGAKTLLVERYGYLGGMVTGAYITWYAGFGNGKRQITRGLAEEFIVRLRDVGGWIGGRNTSGDVLGDAEFIKWLSIVMLEEAGAEILLHSLVVGVLSEDDKVKGIIVESKSGRGATLARVTIDATADGDVAHFAGARTELDHHRITVCTRIKGIDERRVMEFKRSEPEKFANLMSTLKEQGGIIPGERVDFFDRSAIDADDLTLIENEGRKRAFQGLLFMRKNVPGYESAKIGHTAPQVGVRESRKLVGEYTITEADMLSDRKFDDTIGRSGAQVRGRKTYAVEGLEYDVPYRCLLPERIDDLLAAGRCISATHEAIDGLRLVVPCMMTGHAAGAAAAIAVADELPPRKIDIAKLQTTLKAQGANLG